MKIENKNIVMLAGPGYEDFEFWAVYMRMAEEGANIKVVGLNKGEEYTSKSGGLKVKCGYSALDVIGEDIDAVLIPGGWAPDKLRRDSAVLELVWKVYKQGKIIGMICHAGWVGISAGIV